MRTPSKVAPRSVPKSGPGVARRYASRILFGAGVAVATAVVCMPAAETQADAKTTRRSLSADAGAPSSTTGKAGKGKGGKDAGASATTALSASASADGGVAESSDGGSGVYTQTAPPPTLALPPRPSSPPPPPPTAAQLAALSTLEQQADAYAKGAKDYRDTVTDIIKLHYQEKKREILSSLDRDIKAEKKELTAARETAIKRLEEFVAKYSGPNAQPEATPDAMYRLAALYEERARSEDTTEPLETGLKPAIALYKRVVHEFPDYTERAGIFYFLGHAYNDSGRTEEAQQVWRSLVCHNKFPYPTAPDPKNPDGDTIVPLPQDHDTQYWNGWRAMHADYKKAGHGADGEFVDPYPQDCVAVAQPNLTPGQDPKYVAEIWWQIGNWEFDQLDLRGGVTPDEVGAVWDYDRAASAYQHSMVWKKPPLYGVSLYKYSWTLFKQQRYDAATREFVALLVYTDQQQKETGDPGADFRGEAYTYIAGSLTNLDFVGPGPNDPFIQRPDILDTEPRPDVAEKKLHVAIDRVRDPSLIPQDRPWTIEIYKALAEEFRSLNQFNNAIEIYDTILKKWPMDPTAPEVQNSIAETYDQMNITKRSDSPEHEEIAGKALAARTALANYIGNSAWVDANKDNPQAIEDAEKLVRGGLRQAAVQHTNNGKAALVEASNSTDPNHQIETLTRAESEYKLAALDWAGFLKQDENAPDAYESRYWLADARHQGVRIAVVLHKLKPQQFGEPTSEEITTAKASAIDVRDSNEDDKYLDNSALFVVDESDIDRDLAYQRFDDSAGSQGVERRSELKFTGDGADKKVVKDVIPPVVTNSMQARDEYIQRVPEKLDPDHNAVAYEYYVGETYFLYGDFVNAKARYQPMYEKHCGKDEYGYRAWEKLITMSNASRDVDTSRKLAEAEKTKSCAVNAEQKGSAGLIVNPTLQEAAYVDARKKFEQARNSPPGPERDKLWREAGGLYEAALSAAPARDEAPEAAMNAAYAYKQLGDFNKAIELYNKFITEYGSDARLAGLQNGDAKAKVAPNPKKYAERLQYLNDAYDALGTTYYSFFNYQRAAETYEKVAGNQRFSEDKRKTAAKNAIVIYAAMGQRDKAQAADRLINQLHPTPDEKLAADYQLADYDYKQWDPHAGDSGANRQSRIAALDALTHFYTQNRHNTAAGKYTTEAAYQIGKMKKQGGDADYRSWYKTTILAWEDFKAHAKVDAKGKNEATLPPFVDYAAECEYALVDEDIHAKWDTAPDRKTYSGAIDEILGKFDDKGQRKTKGRYIADTEAADKYDLALDHIVKTYASVEWVPTAMARQGSIYDGLRTGLYNTVPPQLKYFTPAQDKALKALENSGRDALAEKADDLRGKAREGWRSKKDSELAGSDQAMVRRYASAVALARKYNVRNDAVQHAIEKLAYYTDIIGEAKMREYVTATPDPIDGSKKLEYRDGMYVQSRPGLTSTPAANGGASFAPVAP